MKNINICYKNIVGAAASFTIAYMTATGQILNYIEFAGVDNEMAFFAMSVFAGTIFTFCIFSKK